MPVRDGEDFVGAAVSSVLQQTYRELRLLAVDDGSADATAEILNCFADSDPRMEIVRLEEGRGLAGALAYAMTLVTTEYVARLDADDLARPRRLERQIAFLDANPAVGLLGSACTVFDEGGVRERWSPPCDPLAVRWRSVLANPLLHSTVAIRRSVLVDGNLNYDPALAAAQDYDLWSRTLLHTEAANLRAPLVCYRMHAEQLTRSRRSEQLAIHQAIASSRLRNEVPEIEVSDDQIRDLRAFLYGAGDSPRDVGATASLFLDLLEAFLSGDGRPSTASAELRRVEARRVAGALIRNHEIAAIHRLGPRLLRLDPLLPLSIVRAAISRTRTATS